MLLIIINIRCQYCQHLTQNLKKLHKNSCHLYRNIYTKQLILFPTETSKIAPTFLWTAITNDSSENEKEKLSTCLLSPGFAQHTHTAPTRGQRPKLENMSTLYKVESHDHYLQQIYAPQRQQIINFGPPQLFSSYREREEKEENKKAETQVFCGRVFGC